MVESAVNGENIDTHGNDGLVAVEFVWRHSIARPRKPPVIRKNLGDISHI